MKNLHTYPPLKMEQTERSYLPTYEDEIDRVFRNVAIQNSDAGELPRRNHTTRNVSLNYVTHNIQ